MIEVKGTYNTAVCYTGELERLYLELRRHQSR